MFNSAIRGGALLIGFALTFAGCGSGGGAAPVVAALLATLKADLQGSNEVTVVDGAARGAAVVELWDDGEVRFAAVGEAAWISAINMMHIHRGAPGAPGGIEVDLLSGGATFSGTTLSTSGSVISSAILAAEIAANPGGFYVNIHTTAALGGLVRGQLAPFAPLEWHATLLGSEEVPVADTTARGAATFRASAPRTLDYVLAMANPAITVATMAHIHFGPRGTNGGILVDLLIGGGVLDAVDGTITGSVTLSLAVLARLCADPSLFYANIHSTPAPIGLLRGQLTRGPVEMWAPLSGAEETTVVDLTARGGATIEFNSFTEGVATLAVPPAQGIDTITAAHVHVGGLGVPGGVLFGLIDGADYNESVPTGSSDGTVRYTQKEFTRILANPGGFYVNLHTAMALQGLVRGQLTRDPITMFAALDGAEEVPDARVGSGAMTCLLTGVHESSFSITMVSPPAGDLTGAHIHDGAAGLNGPILIDFLGGTNVTTAGTTVTGDASFTGRTFARLLAAPELFYCNVHTAALPGGVARGQCVRVTQDTPPAGLTYQSPVVYQTGSPISQNAPSSVGGAVASYSVAPALPGGLTLDTVTGIISGTPNTLALASDYTVTATNAAGDTSAIVTITVNAGPPTNLSYTTPVTYTVGIAIPANVPTNTGGAITNYTVAPALPSNLQINANTGVISGTPNAAAAATDYTVTGTNSGGNTMAVVNITVNAALQPPTNLSYTTPVTYTTGTAITPNTPTVTGSVTSWSISPTFANGLQFSTATGVISGTPTSTSAATNHTVTASNAAGNAMAVVNITVNVGAPNITAYSNSPNVGYVTGGTFAPMTPTNAGGASTNWTISPALPTGISINGTTGVISGIPAVQSSQTNYTVTATNSGGNSTFQVTIVILP